MSEEDFIISMAGAAKIANVSRQAIYKAIKLKRLKATLRNGRYYICPKDFVDYRWSRKDILYKEVDGELIYDMGKGTISPHQASCLLGVNKNRIYYLIRSNKLSCTRHGFLYIIKLNDIKTLAAQMGINLKVTNENINDNGRE